MLGHTGTTKVLTCAENWIAAGSNSGTVNSLDLRNGEFLCTWRPSEFPSAQVCGHSIPLCVSQYLVYSVWGLQHSSLVSKLFRRGRGVEVCTCTCRPGTQVLFYCSHYKSLNMRLHPAIIQWCCNAYNSNERCIDKDSLVFCTMKSSYRYHELAIMWPTQLLYYMYVHKRFFNFQFYASNIIANLEWESAADSVHTKGQPDHQCWQRSPRSMEASLRETPALAEGSVKRDSVPGGCGGAAHQCLQRRLCGCTRLLWE